MTSADEQLRNLERRYLKSRSCDDYRYWMHAARRAGKPLFTPEGIVLATGGQLISYQETLNGFRAEVKDAVRPLLYTKIRISQEDYEYERIDGWSGIIYLDCDDISTLDPTVVIDGDVTAGGNDWGLTQSATYCYVENVILNEAQLIAACLDNRYYPVDKHGWDNG